MKYATVILALAAGAFAIPQAASVTPAPSTPSPATGLTPAVSCAMACKPGDVTCQAACLGNARPNASQAIATNECAAKCDQGDGSPAASDAYSKCVQSCINSLFPSSQTGTLAGNAQASAAASAASGSNNAKPTASQTGAAASAGSGTGAGGAQKTNAADANSARMAGAGLAGLLAVFVL